MATLDVPAIPLAAARTPAYTSNARRQVRRFTRNRMALAGLGLVTLLLLVGIFAPLIAPYPEDAEGAVHTQEALLPPSPEHRTPLQNPASGRSGDARAWRTRWSPRRCGVAGPASGRTALWMRC